MARHTGLAALNRCGLPYGFAIGFAMSCASIRYHSGLHQDGKPIGPHWLTASWLGSPWRGGEGAPVSRSPFSLCFRGDLCSVNRSWAVGMK